MVFSQWINQPVHQLVNMIFSQWINQPVRHLVNMGSGHETNWRDFLVSPLLSLSLPLLWWTSAKDSTWCPPGTASLAGYPPVGGTIEPVGGGGHERGGRGRRTWEERERCEECRVGGREEEEVEVTRADVIHWLKTILTNWRTDWLIHWLKTITNWRTGWLIHWLKTILTNWQTADWFTDWKPYWLTDGRLIDSMTENHID